jgi:hypothetical protein
MKKIEIFIIALSLFFSFAAGWIVSDWFNQPLRCPDCEKVDYEQIGKLMEKVAKAHSVQGFDVEKIKNVRGFTYAPQSIYQVEMCRDSLLLRKVMEQIIPQTNQVLPKKKRLFQ